MFFPEFNAKLLEGSADGNLTISFPSSADPNAILSARSEFTVARMKVGDLVGNFTGDVSMSGRLDGSFTASVSATTVGALMNMPTVSGDFMIRDGAMSNVDLVQAMRSPGNVGGQTKYSELAGKLRISDGIIRYESLKMAGGLLFAGGNLNVTYGTGVLNGTLNSEIRSKVAQDRAVFAVSGTVARPLLKRGG